MLKELIKVIQQERYTYSDPVTEFLECLYVNYDFEGAQKKLRECEEVRLGLYIMQQSSLFGPLLVDSMEISVCFTSATCKGIGHK